jgi:hypothetical protein
MLASMNAATRQRLQRHIDLAERWPSGPDAEPVLGDCKALLLEAERLESDLSAQPRGDLDPQILECFGALLRSLATVALLFDQSRNPTVPPEDSPDPTRLLFAINQNLQFAAETAELAGLVLSDGVQPASG